MGGNISVLGSTSAAGDLRDTGGLWERVRARGKDRTRAASARGCLSARFYGSLSTGIAVFDDIALEELLDRRRRIGEARSASRSNEGGGTLPDGARALETQSPPAQVSRGLFFTTPCRLISLSRPGATLWRSAAWRRLAAFTAEAQRGRSWLAEDRLGTSGHSGGGPRARPAEAAPARPRSGPPHDRHRSSECAARFRTEVQSTSRAGTAGRRLLRLMSQDISDGGIFVLHRRHVDPGARPGGVA